MDCYSKIAFVELVSDADGAGVGADDNEVEQGFEWTRKRKRGKRMKEAQSPEHHLKSCSWLRMQMQMLRVHALYAFGGADAR
jgi:hypothetical protein